MFRNLFVCLCILTAPIFASAQEDLLEDSGFSDSSLDRATIHLTAEVGKAFGTDLTHYTHVKGNYSALELPSWLSLSAEGILYGTATEAQTGSHEAFISVLSYGKEYNFHLVVTVGQPQPATKYSYRVNVDEVLKIDLSKSESTLGTYSYSGLPAWLKAKDNGILYGVPKASDVGETIFDVSVAEANKTTAFKVKVTVGKIGTLEPTQPTSSDLLATMREGERLRLNIFHKIGIFGEYAVHSPYWLRFYPSGDLEGWAPRGSAGTYPIYVRIRTGSQLLMYTYKVEVTN